MAFPLWSALGEAGPWRWVLAAGVGLLVLLGLGLGAWSWYSVAQSRGLQEVAQASARAQEALALPATAAQRDAAARELEEVVARYPSNRLIPQAAYHLGNLRYQAKAYGAARGAYTLALAKGAHGALAALCRLGIGYAWEADGKYGDALGAYEDALSRLTPADFLYEEALIAVARGQELSDKLGQALETYRRVLKEVPQSRRAADIRWRLATLESRRRP